ncbi:unnamed protein product [Rhizoctonia solani]|uniref:Protein kinase domain-containing protein n=1 Tax=Rhizoctonia solani TaxID=456999 RepID=A0A8H3BCY6_9AGAM|nr:unnamed protein product [Rhizoctonia solani]
MLMDFGNASLLEATLQFTQTTTGIYISPEWTAPEILKGTSSYTMSGDIYSLGMTMLEAFTSQAPFPGRNNNALIIHIVVKKNIPDRPQSVIPSDSVDGDKLWAILTRCWSYEPEARPTAETVWNEMEEITAKNLKAINGEEL